MLLNVSTPLKYKAWDFLGSPVARTLQSQCRGPGLNSWSGNWIQHALRACLPQLKVPQATVKTLHATTETCCSQINENKYLIKINGGTSGKESACQCRRCH